MKRPTGWKANPQAMAAVSRGSVYEGSPDLGKSVDGDTWLTPRWILYQLGTFDLDPCACDQEPDRIAPKYFLKQDNGLGREWEGRVFMNPPFSDTRPWLERHAIYGKGISLVPASVESVVWRNYVWPKSAGVLLLHGRTRFCNPDGSTTTGRPLRSIALIAWSAEDFTYLEKSTLAGVLLNNWSLR